MYVEKLNETDIPYSKNDNFVIFRKTPTVQVEISREILVFRFLLKVHYKITARVVDIVG